MAVTITLADLIVAIRAGGDVDAIDPAVEAVVKHLSDGAQAVIEDYAPNAPEGVQNAAQIRLVGWLYDSDIERPRSGSALRSSGAESLLAHFRIHRAGVLGGTAVAPVLPAAGLPPLPSGDSDYILTGRQGVLKWVEFPLP